MPTVAMRSSLVHNFGALLFLFLPALPSSARSSKSAQNATTFDEAHSWSPLHLGDPSPPGSRPHAHARSSSRSLDAEEQGSSSSRSLNAEGQGGSSSPPHAHLLNYSSHRRILVRPLLHLGLSKAPDDAGYPLMYITSAFLGKHALGRCKRHACVRDLKRVSIWHTLSLHVTCPTAPPSCTEYRACLSPCDIAGAWDTLVAWATWRVIRPDPILTPFVPAYAVHRYPEDYAIL